jgi:hypothetical protein
MSKVTSPPEVYQLHMWLREISPMIWRRLLVCSDSTIADLHYTLQIAMGWESYHLHQFIIQGKHTVSHSPGARDFRMTQPRSGLPTCACGSVSDFCMSMTSGTCGNMKFE